MTEQELLAQLRDVRLPAEPGWWPPAIGWWVIAVILLALFAGVYFAYRRWRDNAWRRVALNEHKRLAAIGVDGRRVGDGRAVDGRAGDDRAEVLTGISELMRRVALKVERRDLIASVTDDQWLRALDRIGQTQEYTQGVGKHLSAAPYQNNASLSADELRRLLALTSQTIGRARIGSLQRSSSDQPALKPAASGLSLPGTTVPQHEGPSERVQKRV